MIGESDALMAVLNMDHRNMEDLLEIAKTCAEAGKPWMAVITKTDHPEPQRVGLLRQQLDVFSVPVVAVTALKEPKDARELILPLAMKLVPESPSPLFDPESFTTQNLRDMAAEMVREKCFEHLHQEIPYGLAVKVKKFDEEDRRVTKIYADIMVTKDGHKAIVVGKGGASLKRIGSLARHDLEKLLGRKVYLELHVIVRKNWARNPQILQELGYVVTQSK